AGSCSPRTVLRPYKQGRCDRRRGEVVSCSWLGGTSLRQTTAARNGVATLYPRPRSKQLLLPSSESFQSPVQPHSRTPTLSSLVSSSPTSDASESDRSDAPEFDRVF